MIGDGELKDEKTIRIRCGGEIQVKLEDLHFFQKKLKTITEDKFLKLKRSLIKDGLPIAFHVWWNAEKHRFDIMDGHHRYLALKSLESDGFYIPPIPCNKVEANDRKEAAKIVLISNSRYARINEESLSDFMIDFELQLDEINLLDIADVDFEEICSHEKPSSEGQCDPDEIPEDVPTKAKLCDLFILGGHRLLCGDSTDLATVERLMNGEKADMVFTDPPYEIITEGGGLLKESSAMKKIKKLGIDSFDPDSLNKHAETNIFCCNKPLIKKYIELAEKWDCAYDLAVYHKQNITPNYGGHLMTDLEYIFIIGKQAPRTGINEDKRLYSKLYSGNKDADNTTAWSKPVELCQKFIKLYSTKNVLDYFGGSGSTLIACEKTNRKCFMMELDPHYIDVIISRWQKFTGKKAVREDGLLWDDIE